MTPDERSPGGEHGQHGQHGPEPRDPVADFFAAQREDIPDLHGDDARWLEITREAGRPHRSGWLRYAAVAAAVVVVGGSAWAVGTHRGGGPVAAGRPSATQTVYVTQSPTPSSALGSGTAPGPSASLASPTAPTSPSTAASTPTPVPADFVVASVSTVRDGRLFALGRATCTTGPCTVVATSMDRGASWSLRGQLPDVGLASRESPTGALTRSATTVSDIRFATDSIGWAFGGTVLRTVDGGRSWSPYPHVGGAAVLDVETDGTDVVLTTAASCDGATCSGPVSVVRAPATSSAASSAGDLGGVIDTGQGVTAADIGWSAGKAVITVVGGSGGAAATGAPGAPGAPGASATTGGSGGTAGSGGSGGSAAGGIPAQVLRTDGLHPVAVTGCTTPGASRLVTPSSGTTLYALCPPEGAAGSLVLGVVASGDGGATWKPVTSTGPAVANAGTVSATASDAAHLLVVSGGSADRHGSMTVSSDGGTTWHAPASPPPPPDRGWAWVGSPGAGTFYAVPTDAVGGFWRSTDGGETWTRVTVGR